MNTRESHPSDGANCEAGELVSSAATEVSQVLTGIPAPLQKTAWKALGRMLTGLADVPAAYLEGIAAEIRASTASRVKIISTTGDKISSSLDVPAAYAEVAVRKFGQRVLREQVNLDAVAKAAAEELRRETTSSSPSIEMQERDVADDWLNAFEREASQKSSAEMRALFGRILAGEIRRPESFSTKTVKLVAQLDTPAATLFRRLCSMCMGLRSPDGRLHDARVLSLKGSAASNSLADFGLNFRDLNVLVEHGLIISDLNSWLNYGAVLTTNGVVAACFSYQGAKWGLTSTKETKGEELKFHGVSPTRSGMELLDVVEIEPVDDYTNALRDFLKKRGLEMAAVA